MIKFIKKRLVELIFSFLIIIDFFDFSYSVDIIMFFVYLWNIYVEHKLREIRKTTRVKYLFLISQIIMIGILIIGIINSYFHTELQNTFIFIIQMLIGLMYIGSIIYLTNLFLSIEQKKKNGLIIFALIFVIPIGIWNIQPRLNELIEEKD